MVSVIPRALLITLSPDKQNLDSAEEQLTKMRKVLDKYKRKVKKLGPMSAKRLWESTEEECLLDSEHTPPLSPDKARSSNAMDLDSNKTPGTPVTDLLHDVPLRMKTHTSDAALDHLPHVTTPTTLSQMEAIMLHPDPTAMAEPLRLTPHSPPPPPKRLKGQEAKFHQGFVEVVGVKPKAGDYVPVVKALLLHSMAEHSARILTLDTFPEVNIQLQWAMECWRATCHAAGEHFILSDRMARLITKRGSQIRGKILEAFRALFADHYGLVRSSTPASIKANRALHDKLLSKAAFQYKDKDSLGGIFRSYFDPISLPNLALDFSTVEFCMHEWSSGTFVQAMFYEKDVVTSYHTHLADIENWSSLNKMVVENIRRKWTKRASQTLGLATTSQASSSIDKAQEDMLRDEMEGRTGATNSEPEDKSGDQ
ncbi:hypothetical protein B0H10DRAFT_2244742 [Mycena sp. CBHHK59/15]|nr:hypothetical protein B0H10DRAFT_2244742 [Mycena sp. CBHHK59/15]